MRTTVGVVLAILLLVVAGPAATQEQVSPTNDVPDRAPLRGDDGTLEGFQDRGRSSFRGIARDTAGEADGTVVPNRSGGGTVRGTDGTRRGMAPSRATLPSFTPRSRGP